jgi:hypothetical protein
MIVPTTMLFNLLISVVLAAAVAPGNASSSSASANDASIDRTLQSSILCLASGIDFSDCCPSGADPNDGACTLLTCVNFDNITIRGDDCNCAQLEVACGQVAVFADLVANLSEMCIAVDNCCDGGEGSGGAGASTTSYSKTATVDTTTTSNSDFDRCMATTIEESGLAVPDIDALLPGGDGDGTSAEHGATIASTSDASINTKTSTTSTIAPTIATSSTSSTTLPRQKTVELVADTNDARRYAAHTALSVIGLLLVIMVV